MCKGAGVDVCKEGVGHLETFRNCVVEVSLGNVWVWFGHGGHRERSGGLYKDGGPSPEGPIVVSSQVSSKAGRSDKVPSRFCRDVMMG